MIRLPLRHVLERGAEGVGGGAAGGADAVCEGELAVAGCGGLVEGEGTVFGCGGGG